MKKDFHDRIQRILNEKKKDNLREQFGMRSEGHSEDLSPRAEGEWLDYITDFERQFENAKQISVREQIGNPPIKPLEEIPPDELEGELDALFELLYQRNVIINFNHEPEDREAYRFIVDELLDEMMDDIAFPDMYTLFSYEDFHPNDQDDIAQA